MTAAANFLCCGWSKKTKFITARNVQWTPKLLVPAIKGTSRAGLTVFGIIYQAYFLQVVYDVC